MLLDPASDLSKDRVEKVRSGAPADDGSGTRHDPDADELVGEPDDYEEDNEEVDDKEETNSGGEDTVNTTQHWTDEEAEAAVTVGPCSVVCGVVV